MYSLMGVLVFSVTLYIITKEYQASIDTLRTHNDRSWTNYIIYVL